MLSSSPAVVCTSRVVGFLISKADWKVSQYPMNRLSGNKKCHNYSTRDEETVREQMQSGYSSKSPIGYGGTKGMTSNIHADI